MSLEKDCFAHEAFKSGIFLFSMRLTEGCSNSILLYKITYFASSWDFACMVSELER